MGLNLVCTIRKQY